MLESNLCSHAPFIKMLTHHLIMLFVTIKSSHIIIFFIFLYIKKKRCFLFLWGEERKKNIFLSGGGGGGGGGGGSYNGFGFSHTSRTRRLPPLSSEGSLACHACCDLGPLFYGLF